MIAAFLLPPVALLALYVRGLHDRKASGLAGARWA